MDILRCGAIISQRSVMLDGLSGKDVRGE